MHEALVLAGNLRKRKGMVITEKKEAVSKVFWITTNTKKTLRTQRK
jgi:hypothetical protein